MVTPTFRRSAAFIASALLASTAVAQQVTRKNIEGVSTFAQLETTIACGGATSPAAIPELGKMGFKSVINLRLASEEGAQGAGAHGSERARSQRSVTPVRAELHPHAHEIVEARSA